MQKILGIDPINRRDLGRLQQMPALSTDEILICELIRIVGAPNFDEYYIIRTQAGVDAMNQAYSVGQAMDLKFFTCNSDSKVFIEI